MTLGLLHALGSTALWLFGARTYPQLFRDWPPTAVPCTLPSQHVPSTKRLWCGRRKRPTQTHTHDVGGEEGACWVSLLRLCAPPWGYASRSLPGSLPLQLCLSVRLHTWGAPPASGRRRSWLGGGFVHSLPSERGRERERSYRKYPTLTCLPTGCPSGRGESAPE